MSTHATLGVRFPDGSIQGCYIHYDGATMKERVEDFVERNTTTGLVMLITRAQAAGGIRSFHWSSEKGVTWPPEYLGAGGFGLVCKTDFLKDPEPYVIDEKNWEDYHMGAHYHYLVDYNTGSVDCSDSYL